MRFQLGTLVTTLAMAFLIYAAATRIVFVKIEALIQPGMSGPPPAAAKNDGVLFVVAISATAWLRRRLNRGRDGFCGGCSRRAVATAIRCPRCGTRLPPRGTDEALFPVIFRHDDRWRRSTASPLIR
jgi:hypothetical protein